MFESSALASILVSTLLREGPIHDLEGHLLRLPGIPH